MYEWWRGGCPRARVSRVVGFPPRQCGAVPLPLPPSLSHTHKHTHTLCRLSSRARTRAAAASVSWTAARRGVRRVVVVAEGAADDAATADATLPDVDAAEDEEAARRAAARTVTRKGRMVLRRQTARHGAWGALVSEMEV